jgi:hypothetical protein
MGEVAELLDIGEARTLEETSHLLTIQTSTIFLSGKKQPQKPFFNHHDNNYKQFVYALVPNETSSFQNWRCLPPSTSV